MESVATSVRGRSAGPSTDGNSRHAAPRGGSRRIGGLDGLRVIAILGIVFYHANPTWIPGGFFGVTVFFVLTGYLFTLSVQREIARTGSLGYGRLVLKRAVRLWPVFSVVCHPG